MRRDLEELLRLNDSDLRRHRSSKEGLTETSEIRLPLAVVRLKSFPASSVAEVVNIAAR